MSKYSSNTASYKLAVIAYAETHGNRAAGRKYSVSECNVRYWRKQKIALQETNKSRKAFRGPKSGKFPQVEEYLLKYVISLRNDGYAVSYEMLYFKGREIAAAHGISVSNFKVSRGWVIKFMKRNGLSLRRRTSLCQRMPNDFDQKVIDFHRFVIRKRKAKKYLLSQIGNADQTPISFDMPQSRTIDTKGTSSVIVRTTGSEKQRCTVMLAVTADGRKLAPYVVLKRKTMPKVKFPRGIHVRVQEKGWMDTSLVEDWIRTVWGNRAGSLLRCPALLVLDSFRGHLTENTKKLLETMKTDLAVIPGGLTSVLQPLDVSINKPFKDNVRKLYQCWMAENVHELTPTGKIRKPSVELLCEWILRAWDMISSKVIEKSFKKTGISNALDGTEDDFLWRDVSSDSSTNSSCSSSGDDQLGSL